MIIKVVIEGVIGVLSLIFMIFFSIYALVHNKNGNSRKNFLILFAILSIGCILETIFMYQHSVDRGAWPLQVLFFSLLNLFVSACYITISRLANRTSYLYTTIYGLLLGACLLLDNILFYTVKSEVLHSWIDNGFFAIYCVFLLGYLIFCYLKKRALHQGNRIKF